MDITEAVSEYQLAHGRVETFRRYIEENLKSLSLNLLDMEKMTIRRDEAKQALKRFMTQEAFAEFTGEDNPVTP